MISSNDLKPGMTIQQDGEIFVVLEQSQNKTARSAMVVKAKVRNLRTGSNVELSWGGGDKITPAHIEKKEMQYLYDTDDALVFMDNETYEQIEIPKDRLKWEMNFMKPNDNVNISMFETEILGVILPDKVALRLWNASLLSRVIQLLPQARMPHWNPDWKSRCRYSSIRMKWCW